MRDALLLGLLAWFAVQTWHMVPVFASNHALWAHAAQHAPMKPRVAVNYALVQLQAGELNAGVQELVRAHALAGFSHVPEWDRRLTRATVNANLTALMGAAQ